MTKQTINKETVITALANNDAETMDEASLAEIFENGIKGYKDNTDDELKEFYTQQIDSEASFDF